MILEYLNMVLVGACLLQAPTFSKAYVSFEATHMGVLKVEGIFNQIEGTLERRDDVWTIEGYINVSSINTENSSRDTTLLTEQYFNKEVYPYIPFEAKIDADGSNFSLSVEASIRGLPFSFETSLKVENEELVSQPVAINRQAIGLDFGGMDTLIGDEITFTIHSGINPKELFGG